MRRIFTCLNTLASIPIRGLTWLVQKQIDRQKSEIARKQALLREKMGPAYAEDFDKIDTMIKEWEDKEKTL